MPPAVKKTFAPMASREERCADFSDDEERRPPRSAGPTEEEGAGSNVCPTSFKVTQWFELWTTFRRSVGIESRLLRTTSMWPSLKRSPKAAPRAQTTEARPLPVAGGTSWNLAPSRLRNNWGRSAQVVPQSRLSAMG